MSTATGTVNKNISRYYFADSDAECMKRFKKEANEKMFKDDQVNCR